jgi:uncharacterized membrane protein YgdD (TMEM256/DUF423 family)
MVRLWILVAALAGLACVAAGAFAAHGLRGDARAVALLGTGAQYGMVHAAALLGLAALAGRGGEERLLAVAGWCFAAGIALFSGSLFVLALAGWRMVAALTPVGGILFLAGWASLALHALLLRRR